MLEVDQLFAKDQTSMFQSLLTIQFLSRLLNPAFTAQEQLDSTQAHEGGCVPIKPCLLEQEEGPVLVPGLSVLIPDPL